MSTVRRQDVAAFVGALVILELCGRDVLGVIVARECDAEVSACQHADARTLIGIAPDSDGTEGYGSTLIALSNTDTEAADTRGAGRLADNAKGVARGRQIVTLNSGPSRAGILSQDRAILARGSGIQSCDSNACRTRAGT